MGKRQIISALLGIICALGTSTITADSGSDNLTNEQIEQIYAEQHGWLDTSDWGFDASHRDATVKPYGHNTSDSDTRTTEIIEVSDHYGKHCVIYKTLIEERQYLINTCGGLALMPESQ